MVFVCVFVFEHLVSVLNYNAQQVQTIHCFQSINVICLELEVMYYK